MEQELSTNSETGIVEKGSQAGPGPIPGYINNIKPHRSPIRELQH